MKVNNFSNINNYRNPSKKKIGFKKNRMDLLNELKHQVQANVAAADAKGKMLLKKQLEKAGEKPNHVQGWLDGVEYFLAEFGRGFRHLRRLPEKDSLRPGKRDWLTQRDIFKAVKEAQFLPER